MKNPHKTLSIFKKNLKPISNKNDFHQTANHIKVHIRKINSKKMFLRYVFSGCIATVVNLTSVWLSRQIASYEIAVLVGALFGTATTYIMTKVFVFERKEKRVDISEILRFLVVHGIVCAQIWIVSVSLERWILPIFSIFKYREAIASFIGVGSVVFTGYFLHRYITYRVKHTLG